MPTILVADSRPENLGLYNYLLADAGYVPALCMSAGACHALAQLLNPALIIVDLHLPSLDCGLQAIDRLADDPQTRHIPVLVCTADVNSARNHTAWLRSRVRSVVERPFDVSHFFDTVADILSASTTSRTASHGANCIAGPTGSDRPS